MTDPNNVDPFRLLHTLFHTTYLEQLVSDMTHIIYDVLLLSLLAGRALAPRCLRLLRGKILNYLSAPT
jgi:hypothetical protein